MRLRGRWVETGAPVEVQVEGDRIVAVRLLDTATDSDEVPDDQWLLPGLLDIQVNGFAGVDFNSSDVTASDVREAVGRLWERGVTHLCPTITTNSPEGTLAALRVIREACTDPLIARSVLCVHMEGPFISPEDGARGAHPREHVRLPNWEEYLAWQGAVGGRVGIVTVAPEVPGALELIARLASDGVVPAIGHTDATPAVIRAAVAAGARFSTHLGNGAAAMLPRHDNFIWEQAAADHLAAGMILDGHHLPPSVAKCLIRCKGVDRTILTSDAVSVAGLPPGRYRTLAMDVEVRADRRCSLVGTPYLAGSAIDLSTGVANAVRFGGIGLREAVQMATLNPARLVGVERRLGTLVAGHEASLIQCSWQPGRGGIETVLTMIAGEVVYRA